MSIDLERISPWEVEEARRKLTRLKEIWRRSGFADVALESLVQQEQTVNNLACDLDQRQREHAALIDEHSRHKAAVRKLTLPLKLWEMAHSLFLQGLLFAVALSVILLLGLRVGSLVNAWFGVLVIFASAHLAILVGVIAYYVSATKGEVWIASARGRLAKAHRDLATTLTLLPHTQVSIRTARKEWEEAAKSYESMLRQYRLARSVEMARQRYDSLLEMARSNRYRLLHCGWMAMRSTEFEVFLQEVFETLGYMVETTKASGDQGIDLIVQGKGRRIGVQAKGYSGNVGNHAVMEAHTGMSYYRCDCCIVITNSEFTRHARELAQRIGCRLIASSEIPDLIQGKLGL